MDFHGYQTDGFYDELFETDGTPRHSARAVIQGIEGLPDGEIQRRQKAAEAALLQMGITFTVYGHQDGTEKIFPFDIVPRIVDARDWERIERGLVQRVLAMNQFVQDIYHDRKILKDKVIPEDLLVTAASYRKQCEGLTVPRDIWIHISGIDLVRERDGVFYVLEDNLRCPSGVSYVLENRELLKQNFPDVFRAMKIRPVYDYPSRLRETLEFLVPDRDAVRTCLLTPGMYNSAYFEHAFLAQQMGVELVEGRDLIVVDGFVMMRTTRGLQRVDVIYRRIDDDFLDPKVFRGDSMLGVAGLYDAYRSGRVALANAPGTGVADDKAVYAYVPKIIRYYLGEDAIIPNVPTYLCSDATQRQHVLENLDKLVVKSVNLSGGYGMLIGPHSTARQREEFADKVRDNPRDYIAQPTLSLSRAPVIVDDHFEGRHVDLRPYVLFGKDLYVLPGGLTRVALTKGSLVVNSSQGGGSKDTWVLAESRNGPTPPTDGGASPHA